MAVQAPYFSNAISQAFCTRGPEGDILDDPRMDQSRDQLIGQLFNTLDPMGLTGDAVRHPAGVADAATAAKGCDHLNSNLNCNALASRKRSRDEAAVNMEAAIYQQLTAHNFATSTQMGQGSVRGFKLPVFESSASSSYEQPSSFAPTVLPELMSLYYQHDYELHTLLSNQIEKLRWGMEEARKRHYKALLFALGQHAFKKLREKDAELASASRRNSELEETARQLSSQGLIWFNLAKKNESLVSILRARLEEALIKSASAVMPPVIEGYGDSEPSLVATEDVQSCTYGKARHLEAPAHEPPASDHPQRIASCRVCQENEVSMLVLPCKHLCLCRDCDAGVQTCPVCRLPKTASLLIHMS